MYDQRVKVFIWVSFALLLICVARLAQMQLLAESKVRDEIARLKERQGQSKQLKTLRGKILDRSGKVVATDTPRFEVYINYRLSSYLDNRVVDAKLAEAKGEDADPSLEEVRDAVEDREQELKRIIAECTRFGASPEQIEATLTAKNNKIWNLRAYLAWYRGHHDPNLMAEYNNRIDDVPFPMAMADLEDQFPDPDERFRQIAKVDDIPEVGKAFPLVELTTEDDVFAAQVAFREIADVNVLPTGHRYYPYGTTAAQTIGWVSPAQSRDKKLFEDDPRASYLADEVCGREDGVEYVCESILRGRRGELVYDIDRQLVREIETQFGQDVQLTLDIELQKQIEEWLSNPEKNPDYCHSPMAAAVVEIGSGDILALVSLPTHDLNSARYDYGKLVADANHPLTNRAISGLYAPGSVVKPSILIAGLEAGLITPEEPISCPAEEPPKGWPRCLIFRRAGVGHDGSWVNNARNAMKGSCNIYFSRLADRLDPRLLQEWLFEFGYGRKIPLACPAGPEPGDALRNFLQAPGQIGSTRVAPYADIESFDQIPPLKPWQKKLFGIGHGDFRVTPLQVANTFATLARDGRHRMPRLFLHPAQPPAELVDLQISPTNLATAREGISAVINERGGTAYDEFKNSDLYARGVKVYGKTGSTEEPENAWFAGYAEDRGGAKIAVAVVIEGGQHGGSDAGPMGRAILELCAKAGYLGD